MRPIPPHQAPRGKIVLLMARPRWKGWLIVTVKMLVAILLIWGVGRHVLRTWQDLQRHPLSIHFQPLWLTVSGLLYLVGLSCSGRFYDLVLRDSPTPIALGPALRAYLLSHLGKYVPGKAMVVVMRAGLSIPYGARGATAAIATFYETLVMMASGSLIAALGFAIAGESVPLKLTLPVLGPIEVSLFRLAAVLGLGLGVAFLVVVSPPVFRRLSLMFTLPFPKVGGEALPRFSLGLLVQGLEWSAMAWILLGVSQLALAHALVPLELPQILGLVPVVIASVALATVAGFVVAVLPGGLGVREGVLMYALSPGLGEDLAVVAALALRLVWVGAEVLAAAVLLPMGPWYRTGVKPPLETDSSRHD